MLSEYYANNFWAQKPEPIHELNIMTKIHSLDDALDAVTYKRYIVGSVAEDGEISFSENPTVHPNAAAASAECARLADTYRGKIFIFVQLAGASGTLVKYTNVSI